MKIPMTTTMMTTNKQKIQSYHMIPLMVLMTTEAATAAAASARAAFARPRTRVQRSARARRRSERCARERLWAGAIGARQGRAGGDAVPMRRTGKERRQKWK